jgi:hypothetical protein
MQLKLLQLLSLGAAATTKSFSWFRNTHNNLQ